MSCSQAVEGQRWVFSVPVYTYCGRFASHQHSDSVFDPHTYAHTHVRTHTCARKRTHARARVRADTRREFRPGRRVAETKGGPALTHGCRNMGLSRQKDREQARAHTHTHTHTHTHRHTPDCHSPICGVWPGEVPVSRAQQGKRSAGRTDRAARWSGHLRRAWPLCSPSHTHARTHARIQASGCSGGLAARFRRAVDPV